MSGLAQFVTTELSSDIAVWYCVNSGFLNQPTDRDTFRFHTFNMQPMIEIVEQLGYPIDKGVLPHFQRTKALMFSLSAFKKLENNDKKEFKEKINCLTQNCIEVDKEKVAADVLALETCIRFVPIDGPASEANVSKIVETLPKDLKILPIKEIIHFGSILDAQKSASDYRLEYDFTGSELPKEKIEWEYGLNIFEK